MTLTQLAKLAGTSVGTVSKAFSGSREISDETKKRIFETAKQHGCFDKYYKAPRKRPLIALMPPEPEGEFYGREIGLIEKAFTESGADTIITFTRFDHERQEYLFRELAYGLKVDGIVLWGIARPEKNLDQIPLVIISATKQGGNSDTVTVDFESGINELAITLKRYGHSDVGFIGERLTTYKEVILKKAMRKEGIAVHDKYFVRSRSRFAAAGVEGMKELIKRNAVPSVIVAGYDQIAYGAMQEAQANGYRIPEDISFVGMDDITSSQYGEIPLSSLCVDFESMCPKIVELIYKRIENRYYRTREELTIPVKPLIRDSLCDKNK